ncbi:MAG TPA: DegT/DnrJ/EryC1/StrS family aminotransferase [Puia sp.]|nr:DegT/DnrJ/EryC1/StrS family aminotransferase [Puia sp.]
MKIPFAPPFIDAAVLDEVIEALKSGWITSGPRVRLLESMLQEFTQLPACVCVNSWTSGAQLVLKWWGVGPGDEVIVPAYTYAATALVVLHAGATPVMVDAGEDFTLQPSLLRKALSPRTKAIIPVDFAGWPCDYAAIRSILQEPETRALFTPAGQQQQILGRPLMIADAAHSLGAIYEGKPAGLQADVAVYSLHAVKNITTAEGGVIGLNLPPSFTNQEIYRWMKINSLNGQTKDAFEKTQGSSWRYDIVSDGLKVNMPDICAALGIAQLRQYDQTLLPERRRIAWRYHERLRKYTWVQLPPLRSPVAESAYHIFPLGIKGITEAERDGIIDAIQEKGVSVNVHFIPLPLLTLFREKGYRISDYPVSHAKFSTEITLPVYPQLTDEEVDYVVYTLIGAYNAVTGNKTSG